VECAAGSRQVNRAVQAKKTPAGARYGNAAFCPQVNHVFAELRYASGKACAQFCPKRSWQAVQTAVCASVCPPQPFTAVERQVLAGVRERQARGSGSGMWQNARAREVCVCGACGRRGKGDVRFPSGCGAWLQTARPKVIV